MEIFLGIDCGGTHLRVGMITEDGHLIAATKRNSPLKTHPSDFGIRVYEIYQQLVAEKKISAQLAGIGVGVPGPLDLEAGLILPSSNLNNLQPISVVDQLKTRFNAPVFLDRDTNMALRGELWQGSVKGVRSGVMLTLGTGVGGAILIDGKINEGQNGLAGELGHMIIQVSDNSGIPLCGLGHRGCLESYIQANRHDLEKISFYLGTALANIVDIFNPEMIIIGGGMVKQGNFLPQAIQVMKKKGMKPSVDQVRVVYAKLADLAGVYGAVKFCIDSLNEK